MTNSITTGVDTELFHGLDAEAARRLAALGVKTVVPAGSLLFALGAPADTVFLIERGRISLTLPVQLQGREVDLLVEEKVAGQMVGWSALIPPHRFTLKAAAPVEAEVLGLSRAALLDHFAGNPEVAYLVTRNIAAVVGQRLQVFQTMWLRQMQRVVEQHAA
ncbi:MAG: cyclic nucleotide-binding domain-containing protein [Vicinamibacterales bacterium]